MNNEQILNFLKDSGIKKLVGVIGSGDSLKIADEFVKSGGQLIVSPTEFSAPIIASAINNESKSQSYAASISIRGPGLISSTPGIYFNLIEDLRSISIAEGLNKFQVKYNFHKQLDYKNIFSGLGFEKKNNINLLSKFELSSHSNNIQNLIHITTQSENIFVHNRSMKEIILSQSNTTYLKNRKKIFVFGKRAIKHPQVKILLDEGAPFFLTPAALPYVSLNLPNYLGVWTGNEQSKYLKPIFTDLKTFVIIRVEVMKRELLTLKEEFPHYDIGIITSRSKQNLENFMNSYIIEKVGAEKELIVNLRQNLAKKEHSWSVYAVISYLNELKPDVNYIFDVGSFATLIENFLIPIKIKRLHSTFIGKFMGTAIPIATGIGIANSKTPIVCFLGEGSFSGSYQDLASLVHLKLPVCIIVFSDNSLHSVTGSMKGNIGPGGVLPINFKTLEKSLIHNLPTHFVTSIDEFSNIFKGWQRIEPILLILKFRKENYARGVDFLR